MSVIGAIGLDLGSLRTIVGCAKRGGVEILTNEASHRETLNVLGYSEKERFIGEQAQAKMKSNFKNSLLFVTRFLNLDSQSPEIDLEKRFTYCQTVSMPNGRIGFKVRYKGQDLEQYPEQALATLLQKYKGIVRKEGIGHSDFVISVPGYFTDQERKSILTAAKIAEINVVRLMNESTATALNYGIFRASELTADPRTVLFVDFGHSKTTLFIANFTKEKMSIVYEKSDRHLGARDFDWILYNYYADEFNKSTGIDISKNDKARFRMLEAIEKQRKTLSANTDAAINVDYLASEEDFSYVLKREKFVSLVDSVFVRYRNFIISAIEESKIDLKALHSVELVGGASRIPALQDMVQELTAISTISKTLNVSECVARGCAMQAAMLSPLFKVKEYEMKEYHYYNMKCSWRFLNPNSMEEEPNKKIPTIFERGCGIPVLKSLSFHRYDPIEFTFFYPDPVPSHSEKYVTTIVVTPPQPAEEDYTFKIMVKLNRDGIVTYDSAELSETYFVEEQVPVAANPPANQTTKDDQKKEESAEKKDEGKKMEEEKKTEMVKKKKTRTSNCSHKLLLEPAHNEKTISEFFELECKMFNDDRIIVETLEKKNALEALLYDTKSKLSDQMKEYVTPNEIQAVTKLLTETESWLFDGEGVDSNKSSYTKWIEQIKNSSNSFTKRYYEYQNAPQKLEEMEKAVNEASLQHFQKINDYQHWTEAETQKFKDSIQKAIFFVENTKQGFKKINKQAQPPTTVEEIASKLKEFNDCVRPLFNKPVPPPPKKEEKPKEPEKTEMKDENATSKQNDSKMDVEK